MYILSTVETENTDRKAWANIGHAFTGILLNASTINTGSCNKRKKCVRSFTPKRIFKATNTRREAISVAASLHHMERDPTLKVEETLRSQFFRERPKVSR